MSGREGGRVGMGSCLLSLAGGAGRAAGDAGAITIQHGPGNRAPADQAKSAPGRACLWARSSSQRSSPPQPWQQLLSPFRPATPSFLDSQARSQAARLSSKGTPPSAVDRSLPFPLARSASLSPPTLTALALASRSRSLFSLAPCRPSSPSPQAFSPLPSPHLPSLSHHHAQLAEMANATLTTLLSPLSPALAFAPCINGADCSWTSGWKQGWANDGAWSGLSERYAEGWAVGSALAVSADLQGASRRPSFDWLPMQRMCAGGLPRPWPASLHTARGPSAPLFSLATTDALPSSLPSVPRARSPRHGLQRPRPADDVLQPDRLGQRHGPLVARRPLVDGLGQRHRPPVRDARRRRRLPERRRRA